MSPDEDALLNGIAADPAADLPRLVYADWLEEHGQDLRAEFIRIQCEIAKLEVGPRDVIDRNVHLWRRQQELLDGHMDKLLEGVPFIPRARQLPGIKFYRGFLDELELTVSEFNAQGKHILAGHVQPSSISLKTATDFDDLFQNDGDTAQLLFTSLTFGGGGFVHVSPDFNLPRPEDKRNYDSIWKRLKAFSSYNESIDLWSVVSELRDKMPFVSVVNLNGYQLSDSDVIDLLNAGILQRLSHISLIENAIGDQAAIELADRLGNSPHLKELDLRRNGITTVGQAALLARLGSKVILF